MLTLFASASAVASAFPPPPPLPPPVLTPSWSGTYNASLSTFAFVDSATRAPTHKQPFGDFRFGAVVYGWAFNKGNAPSDHGELAKITAQCAINKAKNPAQKCFTYLVRPRVAAARYCYCC